MLIFATDESLLRLSTCTMIYMDGTFKTCPVLYTQFFSLHGLVNEYVVPLVFVLLSDKLAATYHRLFSFVCEALFKLGTVFNPRTILSYFESGLIEAIQNQFPDAEHSGCHFHFTQNYI